MKSTTNLVAAFAMTFCFAGLPNLGGCDRNGDATNPAPVNKPVQQHSETVTHPDGSQETKKSETVQKPDGSTQTHKEETKTNP